MDGAGLRVVLIGLRQPSRDGACTGRGAQGPSRSPAPVMDVLVIAIPLLLLFLWLVLRKKTPPKQPEEEREPKA